MFYPILFSVLPVVLLSAGGVLAYLDHRRTSAICAAIAGTCAAALILVTYEYTPTDSIPGQSLARVGMLLAMFLYLPSASISLVWAPRRLGASASLVVGTVTVVVLIAAAYVVWAVVKLATGHGNDG